MSAPTPAHVLHEPPKSTGWRDALEEIGAGAPPRGMAALAGVAVLALHSALWRIGQPDWKLDEDAYAQAGWVLVHQGIDTNKGHPPLAKILFGEAQVLFGRNVVSVRLVAAAAFLGSVAVLFVLGRRMAGWWTGIVAAGLFAALPRSMVVGGWSVADLRIDRYALLETVAGALLLVGLWLGWRWIVDGGRVLAAATGVLVGLAGASKLNALVVLVPVLVIGVAFAWGRARLVGDALALGVAALVAFVVPFLVFGRRAFDQIDQTLRFPAERAKGGHLLVLGSDVYVRSPWWANLKYQLDADGPILVGALAVGLLLALTSRRRPAVVYLLGAAGSLIVFAMSSPVALPHYRAIWTAPLVLLVAIGVTDPLGRLRPAPPDVGADGDVDRHPRARPSPSAVVAAVALAVLVAFGAVAMVRLAVLPEGDYRRMAAEAHADGVHPQRILIYGESVAPYFPGSVDALAPFDDGQQPAQMLVLDPSLTNAVSADTVATWRTWARGWGLSPHRVGRLEAWWAAP